MTGGSQASIQSTEPHQSGRGFLIKDHREERGDEMEIQVIKFKIVNRLIIGGHLGVLQRTSSVLRYF